MWKYDEHCRDCHPPAPVLDVEISNPYITELGKEEIRGEIDSGAGICYVSENLKKKLKLFPASDLDVLDIHGNITTKETYFLNLKINGFFNDSVEVATTESDRDIIIGRNVLNELAILLCGKEKYTRILDEEEVKKIDS